MLFILVIAKLSCAAYYEVECSTCKKFFEPLSLRIVFIKVFKVDEPIEVLPRGVASKCAINSGENAID